jgi:hypothetical protein
MLELLVWGEGAREEREMRRKWDPPQSLSQFPPKEFTNLMHEGDIVAVQGDGICLRRELQ